MTPYPNLTYDQLPTHYQHPKLISWINDTQSTTKRLRLEVPQLSFRLLMANTVIASEQEAHLLQLPANTACWGRQILFRSEQQGFLFSSVLIPPNTCKASGDQLTKLGANPLGDLLFRQPHQRQQCGISLLRHPDPLLQTAERYIVDSLEHTLVRHSICHFRGEPLLIHDVFLPRFIDFILC